MTREAVLGAIRRGLKRGELPADQKAMLAGRMASRPRSVIPVRGQLDLEGRIALFTMYVEREFGTVARLASMAEVPGEAARYLKGMNAPAAVVVSPVLGALDFGGTLVAARVGVCGPLDGAALTQAFTGVAETGTLMLPSGAARPAVNNLLPDDALVVVRAQDIVASYEDAFDQLRAAGAMPRNVMLVTGPSRSADIEQTLELGAHGPRRLHVMIVDGPG